MVVVAKEDSVVADGVVDVVGEVAKRQVVVEVAKAQVVVEVAKAQVVVEVAEVKVVDELAEQGGVVDDAIPREASDKGIQDHVATIAEEEGVAVGAEGKAVVVESLAHMVGNVSVVGVGNGEELLASGEFEVVAIVDVDLTFQEVRTVAPVDGFVGGGASNKNGEDTILVCLHMVAVGEDRSAVFGALHDGKAEINLAVRNNLS